MFRSVKSVHDVVLVLGKGFGYSPASEGRKSLKVVHLIYSIALVAAYVLFISLGLNVGAENIDRKLQFFVASAHFVVNAIYAWLNLAHLDTFLKQMSELEGALAMTPKHVVYPVCVVLAFKAAVLVSIVVELAVDGVLVELLVQFFSEILLWQILTFAVILYRFYCKLEQKLHQLISKAMKYNAPDCNLKEFRRILFELNDASDNLNSYYSVPLIFVYLSASVNIILESYYLLSSTEVTLRSACKVLIHLFNILSLSLIFQLIVNKETSIVKELLYTSVRKIRVISAEALALFNQMDSMSLAFKAGNIFEINFSSLLSMLGVFLGYLIILLQMHPKLNN